MRATGGQGNLLEDFVKLYLVVPGPKLFTETGEVNIKKLNPDVTPENP